MTENWDVATFVGSLRKDSYTRIIAKAMQSMAPPPLKLDIVEIGELGFYNQDLESAPPQAWLALGARIKGADAVLFATPEYNRSVPGVLKNVIDVGSRPLAANAWAGKPAAVVSVSPGVMGAFGANQHLRQSLTGVNMPTMQAPEAYIGGVAKLIDAEGRLAPVTAEFLGKFLQSFEMWIRRLKA